MKLLNKSLKTYILFSTFVILVSIPVFYYELKKMVTEDVDESLIAKKAEITSKLKQADLKDFNTDLRILDPDISLQPTADSEKPDTIYTGSEYDSLSKETVPQRILKSYLTLNSNHYKLIIKNSLVDNDELISSILLLQSILVLLFVAGLLLISRYYSPKLWQPFYRTLDRIKNHRLESETEFIPDKTDIDEFADLNVTISKITNRNRSVYLTQKEFTENASHEMQTPLAVFRSKVDLLMQTTPLSEEQAKLIEQLDTASQKMKKLNNALILISKIENHQFTETATVNISVVLEKTLSLYEDQLAAKNIKLTRLLPSDFSITANPTIIEIMLSNLISNSIRHNIQNGKVSITVKDKYFIIANEGKQLPLDTSTLFKRFSKHTPGDDGLGLGTEIIKKICDLTNASIDYTFENNMHTFTITFPAHSEN